MEDAEKRKTTSFIYSGTFSRSRSSVNVFEGSQGSKALQAGVVSVAPLPLYGPPMVGVKPFTEFPLALELAKLGVED